MLVIPYRIEDGRALKVEKLMTLREDNVKIPQTGMEKFPDDIWNTIFVQEVNF